MQIETKNGKLFCVEVPMESSAYTIHVHDESLYICYLMSNNDVYYNSVDADSEREYSIIGTITNGVLDFDAEPYVEHDYRIVYQEPTYKNYEKDFWEIGLSPSGSFLSLLTSQSIPYTNKKIVCLKIK